VIAPPDLDAWVPWSPTEIAERLVSIKKPWCVVGGWAIDLWLGRKTRVHEDLEISVLWADFEDFRRALSGYFFFGASNGKLFFLEDNLPAPETFVQFWCLDPKEMAWRVDLMIDPGTVGTWKFKRKRSIKVQRSEIVLKTGSGIPYLHPKAALLFKAKHMREKDVLDFENVVAQLNEKDRLWLKSNLSLVHPGHVWIERL
jgi:hypothetical protein